LLIAIVYVLVTHVFGALPVNTIVTVMLEPDQVMLNADPDVAAVPFTVISTSAGTDAVGVTVKEVVQYGTVLSV